MPSLPIVFCVCLLFVSLSFRYLDRLWSAWSQHGSRLHSLFVIVLRHGDFRCSTGLSPIFPQLRCTYFILCLVFPEVHTFSKGLFAMVLGLPVLLLYSALDVASQMSRSYLELHWSLKAKFGACSSCSCDKVGFASHHKHSMLCPRRCPCGSTGPGFFLKSHPRVSWFGVCCHVFLGNLFRKPFAIEVLVFLDVADITFF